MGKEGDFVNKNVDLKKLSERVQQFFYDDGFGEVRADEDPNSSWFEIQARKTGAFRTVISSRKAIHIVIKGTSNKFSVSVSTGEWGRNFAVAGLFTGGVGLIGMGFNLKFANKLWKFIQETIASLENTADKKTSINSELEVEDPLQILKKRFAIGEISKDEFEEMKKLLE